MSMSFRDFVEAVDAVDASVMKKDFHELTDSFVSPDDIWEDGTDHTFIYNGKLYLADDTNGNQYATHIEMLKFDPELRDIVKNAYGSLNNEVFYDYRTNLGLRECLFGRYTTISKRNFFNSFTQYEANDFNLPVGLDMISVICFWNKDKEIYKRLLKGLIDALRGKLASEIFVSLPGFGLRHISNLGDLDIKVSEEEKRKLDMWQKLHLMKPDEKKAAMGELGLGGFRASKKGEWESGLRKLGLPGYMTQSEGRMVESRVINDSNLYFISYNEKKGNFINPDRIWKKRGSETIIYCDDKLYASGHYAGLRNSSTHIEMLMHIPSLKKKVNKREKVSFATARRYRLNQGLNEMLFGRLVKGDLSEFRDSIPANLSVSGNPWGNLQLVSFWNDLSDPLLKKMAEDCIKRLYSDGHLSRDIPAFISSMGTETISVSDFIGAEFSGISDEDKRRLELWQKLHLMKPDEKKAAMGELGLGGFRASKKGEWESGLRKLGLPGYMTQSEGRMMESRFINPNDLFYPCVKFGGCVSFFVIGNEIVKKDGDETHFNILNRDNDLRKEVESRTGLSGLMLRAKMDDSKAVLLGRYGDYDDGELGRIFAISLWNKGLDKSDIEGFLDKMIRDGEIMVRDGDYFGKGGERAYLSSREISGYVKDIMGGGVGGGEMSEEEKERLEKWRRLHLAAPDEKRDLMKDLGLGGFRVSKRGEWERGMRDLGLPAYLRQSEGRI